MAVNMDKRKPQSSKQVLQLPVYGTEQANRIGRACMGGRSMERWKNGWRQLTNVRYEMIRCDEVN